MKLHPQVQAFLDEMTALGAPELNTVPVAVARKMYAKGTEMSRGQPPKPASVRQLQIPGPESMLAARLYHPGAGALLSSGAEGGDLPLLLFFHGGGFCIGSLDTHDAVCRTLCVEADCLVLSVDYRLAPEHRFPAAVEDAWAACCWVSENAAELHANPDRIALGGDSAGGNLAAVCSLRARGSTAFKPAFQLLVYPATELTGSYPSHARFASGYRLTRELLQWFHASYLPEGTDPADWRVSPLKAADFSGLPPTFLLSAGFDPLVDENRAFVEKLRTAGVEVSHSHYGDMIHGFITMPGVLDRCREALSECALALKQGLAE